MVTEITAKQFSAEVLKSDKPVIVDFWAPWCGPCRMLAPVLEELSQDMKTTKFVKLNTEDFPELAAQYEIMSIPCLVVFNKGVEADRIIGFMPKPVLKQKIQAIIGK